jgi:hypothetical protein
MASHGDLKSPLPVQKQRGVDDEGNEGEAEGEGGEAEAAERLCAKDLGVA